MTPLLKVLTEYCDTYVDDIRLQELASTNPPLYARKMSQYFIPAIPLFNLPYEMPEYLLGTRNNPKFFEPVYDNKRFTISGDKTEPFEIDLGVEYVGYELFSSQILSIKENYGVLSTPTNICSYDRETGIITVNASVENPIKDNTTFDFDFYTDGWFEEDLSPQIMSILAKCFNVIWQTRFNNDWLSNVSKVEDNSFGEQNRSNKENADTKRLEQLISLLNIEMGKFEKSQYYKQVVTGNNRLKF